MGVITNFILTKSYLEFRQLYRVKKIGNYQQFDLVKAGKASPDVLFHVVLSSEDGAENHAVCVYNNWIFDGNYTNALKLEEKWLDEVCDSKFFGIQFGYMYFKHE
jgi:hypothetical protein